MSLSAHLEQKDSPVRIWIEQHFPETRGVAREANRELRAGAHECSVPRVKGADASLVGTGIDYVLRACLRVNSIDRTAASKAVKVLATDPRIGITAIEVEREAVAGIKRLGPARRDLTDDEWAELCVRCLVLARFEQFYRAGPMNPTIFDLLILPLRRCKGLNDFVRLALTPPTILDLEQLGRAAWADSCELRDARPLVLNPEFQLSPGLGGADADLIAAHRLIDWKATTTTGIVGRQQLWQLVGYVLADTNDEYAIREVSVAALRWRSSCKWSLDALLADLSPGSPADLRTIKGEPLGQSVDLDSMRQDFIKVVEQIGAYP